VPLIKITPSLYQIIDKRNNIFLIVEEKLALIDTGFRGSVPLVLETIRQLGRRPEELALVILTHNHLDHAGGAAALRQITGCKIAARPVDFTIGRDNVPYPGGKYVARLLQAPPLAPVRRRLLLGSDSIDIPLADDQTLPVLGGLKVLFTPGHTPGSVSLYAPAPKILFVGDALNKRNGLPYRTMTMNLQDAVDSALKIASQDAQVLCFGHGKPIKTGAAVYLSHLAEKVKRKTA